MSTSDQLRTYAEMLAGSEFIQYQEKLQSGSLASATGHNRALQRLARSVDALLDVVQSDRNMVITGGGTMAWNSTSGVFSRSSDLTLKMLNEVGATENNVIQSATGITLASAGNVAYAVLDRETNGANPTMGVASSMAAFLTLVTGDSDRLDYQLIAYRDQTVLILWDGRRILNGESLTGNGSTDTQYAQQSEMTLVHTNQKENLQFLLHGGGIVSWDETAGQLTWDAQLVISFPAYAGNNRVPAGNGTAAAGEFLVLTLTRAPGSSIDISGTLSTVADGSASLGDDIFILGHHDSTDGRFYLWDGTALSDGDSRRLGGVNSGVDFFYDEYGDATQVHDLTEGGTYPDRDYKVGDKSLMVYMNGLKAKTSDAYWSGSYPTGALVGSLDDGDRYLEEDSVTGRGSRIIFLADGQAASEPVFHPASTHTIPYTWPGVTDWIESFVGIQGEGPSPVESVGIYGDGGSVLDGAVKLEEGTGVSMSYDAGNNSIVITSTVAAGVDSIEASGGAEGAQTGPIVFSPGTGIGLDDTTPGTIVLNLSADLADLSDVDANMQAAYVGAELPTSSNPLATVGQVSRLEGFDLIRTVTSTQIRVGYGKLVNGGVSYISNGTTGAVEINTTDMYSSDTLTASAWHYVYITDGVSPLDKPVGELSVTAPVNGVHPGNGDYFFLTSVYVNSSSEYTPFLKSGSSVELMAKDVSFDTPPSTTIGSVETIQMVSGTDIPSSGVASIRALFSLLADATGNLEFRWSSDNTTYRMVQTDLTNGHYFSHEFEVMLDSEAKWYYTAENPGGSAVGSIDSMEGWWVTGYSEGRYGTYEEIWT